MTEELLLSHSDNRPMYLQIMEQITAKVIANDWPAGHALPSIRELASLSKVSVITVKRAYLELERAGVIVTRQGKGSFVAESHELQKELLREEFNKHLAALMESARKLGLGTKEVQQEIERRDSAEQKKS